MLRFRCLSALLLLTACTASAPPKPSQEASPPPRMPPEIHWVRNSAEYRALVLQVYDHAQQKLEVTAAGRKPGTWAVTLDADETVISNSQYQLELARKGEPFSRESWYAWARRREARALPGARAFLERVHALGGKIAIVTNRDEAICGDTEANFRALELPYDVLLCRGEESRKEPRWEKVRNGTASPDLPPLEIVMWLGDNIHDFPDWEQRKRSEPAAGFRDFGETYFVLPNPMYGSWTSNSQS